MRRIVQPFACCVVLFVFVALIRAEAKSYEVVKVGDEMPRFSVPRAHAASDDTAQRGLQTAVSAPVF